MQVIVEFERIKPVIISDRGKQNEMNPLGISARL